MNQKLKVLNSNNFKIEISIKLYYFKKLNRVNFQFKKNYKNQVKLNL